ncbi:MAG: hypothetical protein NTY68_00175, partial [Candidatus Micrarchaeota archaeon]|nr:hypothetical protein [Candidatus Micrarchaeota archaeon]
MRKIFILILMAFVAGSFAMNLNQYLYNTSESMSYQNISVENKSYQIISVNGVETFLYNRDDDQLLTDSDQIASVMKKYYIDTYMIKDSDISDILDYISIFDASRNDGTRRANVEEYACRNLLAVGLSGKLNGDPETSLDIVMKDINHIAVYISNDWLGGGDYADPEKLKPHLIKYFNSSFVIDEDIISIKDSLDNEEITESNAYSRLTDAKASIDDIYPLETNLEKTIFRSPKTYSECKDCLGICYYVEMNQSALDSAKSLVEAQLENVSKIENADNIGEEISNRTNERLDYVKKNDEKTYYRTKISSLQSYWESVKGEMNQSMKLVTDMYIIDNMGQINANITGMISSVDALSFDGIDKKYNSTKSSIESVKNRSVENVALFDRLVNASAQADMISILSKNASLVNQRLELDALFTKPVKYETAIMLLENYTAIANTTIIENATANVTIDALLSQNDRNSILVAKIINGFYSPLTMIDRSLLKPYDNYLLMIAPLIIG